MQEKIEKAKSEGEVATQDEINKANKGNDMRESLQRTRKKMPGRRRPKQLRKKMLRRTSSKEPKEKRLCRTRSIKLREIQNKLQRRAVTIATMKKKASPHRVLADELLLCL